MTKPLRIALVADIHHGEDHFTKKGSAALPLLANFSKFVADAKPDVVIDLGDRISDSDRATDLVLEREVADVFAEISVPRFHLCGNHDRDHLSVADNEEILGQKLGHRTVDLGGWRLVLWAADTLIRRPGGFVLKEADLLWLAQTVQAADRALAIMSHVPISGHSQVGNYYFERNPLSATYPGAERARAVLRTARVPVVWASGHVHWNTLTTVDGIPHFTLQSLTETFTTFPDPAGAWALLELDETIGWTVFGRETFFTRIDAAATTQRWVTPLQPFGEHPELRLHALRAAAE
jgi:3',5'-cyclic-AMP phosphodiesterase